MAEPRDRPVPLLERFERFLDAVIPPPDEIASMVRRGEALLGAGDHAGALRIAESALSASPGFLRALLLRADAMAARGAPYDALAVLDVAAKERALPAVAYARMVEYAASLADERRALELESQVRARARGRDPESARRLLFAARALIANGAHAAGLRVARGATLVDPALGAAWLLLADDALKRGDVVQARRSLDRSLPSLDPGDAVGNRAAGEIALALDDATLATRHLRRAWIVGDEASIAPLVMVLSRAGDRAALERVLADAHGSLASIARALVDLPAGDASAREALAAVRGTDVPDALWSLAMDTAFTFAPDIATRWADDAPERAGSAAVIALARARALLDAGDPRAARQAIAIALHDARTAAMARAAFRDACRASWRSQLGVMLDELAVMVRDSPAVAQLEPELRARRREMDEPLRVAILGEFSAGKSTFLNALVGATVSPMGVLPTTAQVHWLRFGEPGARIVDSRGGAVLATIDEAPRVVAKKREHDERIEYVEVTMPVPRLARIELIDTPGFNAGEPDHEAAVRRAFEIADMALWLFDARQAGKLSETGPLQEARAAQLPVLGVLNKIDQVRVEDRSRLMELVRDGFHDLAPLALAISARDALAATLALARTDADDDTKARAREKLVTSGMSSFLAYLDEHLLAQRTAWKQLRIARRVRDLVLAAEDLLARDAANRAAQTERREALASALDTFDEALEQTAASIRREVALVLRDQLRSLEGRRRGAPDEDGVVLANDAAAEVAYRARARAIDQLAPAMRELERLAVEAGIVTAEAVGVVSAPFVLYLDHAASEGVRDALSPTDAKSVALPNVGSATAAIAQAIAPKDARTPDPGDAIRAALEIARGELDGYAPPALPEFGRVA